jgi:hypothetical protein
LSGDWTNARVVAAQDLAADQVNARIQQWMKFAQPARASDQIAALTGVSPAAADPGQPVKLALRQDAPRVAASVTVALPPAAPIAPQAVAETSAPAAPFAPPAPYYEAAEAVAPAAPPVNPTRVADATFAPPPAPLVEPAAYAPPPLASVIAPPPFTRAAVQQRKAKLQRAAVNLRRGGSTAVVQLGAYGSPQRVLAAWTSASRRYAALRAYAPMSASFSSSAGKVYRLSVRGFANQSEAAALCNSMRRSGGSCFVRSVAGDAPVRIASR